MLIIIVPIYGIVAKISIHYGGQSQTYLEPSRTTAIELFAKIVNGFKAVSYFLKKASFDWVINMPLAGNGQKS